MKNLEELGCSPAPWTADIETSSSCVYDNLLVLVCIEEHSDLASDCELDWRNARLIAAAPELYEALVAMLSCAEKESPFTMGSGMSIAMDMARKAIEKAGGAE